MATRGVVPLATAILLFAAAPGSVRADDGSPTPGTAAAAQGPSAAEPDPDRFDVAHNITGDWFGLRNALADSGIDIFGDYAMEFFGNPVGGVRQGRTYVHNIRLGAAFDLERLAGVPHTTFRVLGSQRSGDNLSKKYIGNAINVQELYGGGQTYRLVQTEFLTSLFDDRLSFAYGRIAVTDDFLTSPLYCFFVNNGFCGQPPSPYVNLPNGITSYPTAAWGGRVRVAPLAETYVMVAVYDGDVDQDGNNRHGTNFTLGDNGALVISEAGYTPRHGLFGLPGHYKVGGYYHSGNFDDVSKDVNGNNLFRSGEPAAEFSGNSGYYILLDQMLYREDARRDQGLSTFFVFVISPDQEKNPMPYYTSLGLVYQGPINSRPQDAAAFGVSNAWFSDKLSDARHDAGLERQSTEMALELNYTVQITPAMYVRPDLQYIIRPNGQRDIDNAFVMGFEAGVTF